MTNPLAGKRILVTRPAAQSAELAALIAAQGGVPVLFPLLEIGPVADQGALQQAIAGLDQYAIVIFISPNAVEYSLPGLRSMPNWPVGLQAAAIGPSTSSLLLARLGAHGLKSVLAPPERFDSEALLELPELQRVVLAGRRVLILRGNGGRELLAETLNERGAQVDCVSCYQRGAPSDGTRLLSLLRNTGLDALTVSSSEGLRNLLALLDTGDVPLLRDLPVFVPHRRIAESAAQLGLTRIVLTGPADAGIVRSLCEFNWPDHDYSCC